MNTENVSKKQKDNDVNHVLTDSYFCGVDFGSGKSQAAFTVFKDGNLVWHTHKMWKAKLYIWWKRIWHNVMVLQEHKTICKH